MFFPGSNSNSNQFKSYRRKFPKRPPDKWNKEIIKNSEIPSYSSPDTGRVGLTLGPCQAFTNGPNSVSCRGSDTGRVS